MTSFAFRPIASVPLKLLATLIAAAPLTGSLEPQTAWVPGQQRFAQHDPARKVFFTVRFEEDGGEGDYTWSIRGEALYALLPAWDGAGTWGYDAPPEVSKRLGGQAAPTSELLFDKRGGFTGLKLNEFLQFYAKELQLDGKGQLGGQKDSWTESLKDGVRKEVGCGHASTDASIDPVDNKSATLRRTADGATLTIKWELHGNGSCECGDNVGSRGFRGDDWKRIVLFRLTEKELRDWSTVHKVNEARVMIGENGELPVRVKATLLPAPLPPEEIEVSVTADATYQNWLPKGSFDDPDKPGSTLTVSVHVHRKGDATKDRKARLELSIPSVSEEKGVCLNWPPDGVPGKGLRFAKKDFPEDGPLVWKDETHVESRDLVERVDVVVGSHDFGAWGTLRVTARDADERPVKVRVWGKDTPDLDIPRDDNANRIADAWEASEKISGKPANADDEDEPAHKPGCPGDGISLYEEYRGFRVGGGHVRLDPKKMDLFVCDDTYGSVASSGLDALEHATGLRVRRLKREELDSKRVVNLNGSADTRVVLQHAVLIVDGPAGTSPIAVAEDDDKWGPPRWTKYVQLPEGGAYSWDAVGFGPKTKSRNIADVAHEVGHAVGIRHHGKEPQAVLWRWANDSDLLEQELSGDADTPRDLFRPTGPATIVEAYWEPTAAGSVLRRWLRHDRVPGNFEWNDRLDGYILARSERRGAGAGDTACIMRYEERGVSVPYEGRNIRFIPDPAQWRKQTELCVGRKGTGVNDAGHYPVSRHGDATRGNCRSQLVVSDKHPPISDRGEP